MNNVTYIRYAESARINWVQNFASHIDPRHKKEWSELWTSKGDGLILRSMKTDYKFVCCYFKRVICSQWWIPNSLTANGLARPDISLPQTSSSSHSLDGLFYPGCADTLRATSAPRGQMCGGHCSLRLSVRGQVASKGFHGRQIQGDVRAAGRIKDAERKEGYGTAAESTKVGTRSLGQARCCGGWGKRLKLGSFGLSLIPRLIVKGSCITSLLCIFILQRLWRY